MKLRMKMQAGAGLPEAIERLSSSAELHDSKHRALRRHAGHAELQRQPGSGKEESKRGTYTS